MITLTLTPEQFEKLYETVIEATDEGPIDEGWSSKELREIKDLLSARWMELHTREKQS